MLVFAGGAAAQVSCAKLKQNVPEAARYITWDLGEDAAPAPASEQTRPPPPPPSSH
ncbi:hypothetical protein [Hyalangium gracile]|uniref:hypothetical protein n=1 Tax=Hyalangium gracile TaxID=394092 RepID=UPI001CCCB0BE|nr:hypothetical protein [Hyalangium gracile]